MVQFETLRSQIDELAEDASYKGINFLEAIHPDGGIR
jgi:hypothetical protein